MDFTSYVLAYSRLAKYQIAWWGHPITSGIDTIDYYFGLDIEIPDAANLYYSEQLVRMKYMNTAPMTKSNVVPQAESLKLLNISENSNIKYCAIIGRLFKIHPNFDDAIIRILQNTEDNDTYIIFIAENVINLNRIFHRRLKESFNSHNLSHLLPRVRLVDFSLYSHVLNSAACVLDTFPYGGCLTTHDAFSHGVPMVTLPLEHVRGRYTLGMYQQMDFMELVAKDVDDFVSIATRLLTDHTYQQLLSTHILELFTRVNIDEANDASTPRLHKNEKAVTEWAEFFKLVMGYSK